MPCVLVSRACGWGVSPWSPFLSVEPVSCPFTSPSDSEPPGFDGLREGNWSCGRCLEPPVPKPSWSSVAPAGWLLSPRNLPFSVLPSHLPMDLPVHFLAATMLLLSLVCCQFLSRSWLAHMGSHSDEYATRDQLQVWTLEFRLLGDAVRNPRLCSPHVQTDPIPLVALRALGSAAGLEETDTFWLPAWPRPLSLASQLLPLPFLEGVTWVGSSMRPTWLGEGM